MIEKIDYPWSPYDFKDMVADKINEIIEVLNTLSLSGQEMFEPVILGSSPDAPINNKLGRGQEVKTPGFEPEILGSTPSVPTKGCCFWIANDDEEYWEASCNSIFIFTPDGIEENNFKYCPYCGAVIVRTTETEKQMIVRAINNDND
jgi:hypothetical protein